MLPFPANAAIIGPIIATVAIKAVTVTSGVGKGTKTPPILPAAPPAAAASALILNCNKEMTME